MIINWKCLPHLLFCTFATLSAAYSLSYCQSSPYRSSPVIKGITLDWSTHRRGALGSDNFQLTWADDNNLYGAWGDGGGFVGNDNSTCRVTLGVARIEGSGKAWTGYDVWGDSACAENEVTFGGKSWGMICVNNVLYMWVVSDHEYEHLNFVNLARSFDHGASWEISNWTFNHDDGLAIPTFLNYGKNNDGAKDAYVYSYFLHVANKEELSFALQKPGKLYLARVHADSLWNGRDTYQWYGGINGNTPAWDNVSGKKPVFEDPEGVGPCLSAFHNPGLQRFILATGHTEHLKGDLGIFDAPDPWGPWTTVKYWTKNEPFGKFRPGNKKPWDNNVFFIAFNNKWLSSDGKKFTLNFTGAGRGNNNDSFNTVNGSFIVFPESTTYQGLIRSSNSLIPRSKLINILGNYPMNISSKYIVLSISFVFTLLGLLITIGFKIYQKKIAIWREATKEFSDAIHNELKDIYPVPANWPDGVGIEIYLKGKFPALQSAVNKFAGHLPQKEKRQFLDAWRFYRLGKESREIDMQYYGQYRSYESTTVINGKTITEVTDAKANFKHNVDTLLSYAKQK